MLSSQRFFHPSFRRSFLMVLCAALSWGTIGIANQAVYATSDTNALALTFLRFVCAAPLLVIACRVRCGRVCFAVTPYNLLLMIGMGCLMAACQTCYIAAIPLLGVGPATIIVVCLAPVLIAGIAPVVMHERFTWLILLAVTDGVIGTFLIIASRTQTGAVSLAGVWMALLSACTYAGFILCGRALPQTYHPLQINMVTFGAGVLFLVPCLFVTGFPLSYSLSGWVTILYIGWVPGALGYVLFQTGLQHVSATIASTIALCEPLMATLLAWGLFHEQPGPFGLLGMSCLLVAMLVIVVAPQ